MQPVKIEAIFGHKSLNNLLEGSVLVTTLQSIEKRLGDLAKTGTASTSSENKSASNNINTTSLVTLKKVLDINKNVNTILDMLKKKDPISSLFKLSKPGDFSLLGNGMEKIVKSLILSGKINYTSTKKLFLTIQSLTDIVKDLSKGGDVGDASKFLTNISKGLFTFGLSILVMSPIYMVIWASGMVKIVKAVIGGFLKVFDFTDKQRKGIDIGSKTLTAIAKGVIFLGLALVAAVPLYAIGVVGALFFTGTLWLMGMAFVLLSKLDKNIKDGANTLVRVSLSIVTFGLSLLFWSLVQPSVTSILTLVLTVASIGLVFGLLGAAKKYIFDGALAIAGVGIAIFFLTFTLKEWMKLGINVFEFDLQGSMTGKSKQTAGSLGTLVAVIVGLGLGMAAIGYFKSQVIQGAIAMIIAGFSIVSITYGIKEFIKVSPTWETLGLLTATIGGLGVLMTVAGAAASLIIQGAAAMLLSGLALVSISFGVKQFLKANPTMEQVGVMGAVIGGLTLLMTAAGVASVLILPGAAAMLLAGGALLIIAVAVNKFNSLGLKVSTGDDNAGINKQIELVIGSIVDAFFINPFKTAAMLLSAPVLVIAGGALLAIGSALNKFKDSGFDNPDKVSTLMTNVKSVIEGVISIFSGISNPISAYLGIAATKNIGQSLNGIATGLIKFVQLDANFPGLDFTPGSPLLTNIQSIITGVASAFASINASPIFSAAEAGIDATKNIGQSLMGIANGMMKFTDEKFTSTFAPDPTTGKSKMLDLVVNMISSIMGAFAQIGSQNEGGSNLFGFTITEGNVDKGISLTMRSSKAITAMADGVMKFKDFTPEQVNQATNNINSIVKALFREFVDGDSGAISQKLTNVDKYISMIERLAKITDPLAKVAKSMASIAKDTGNFMSHFKKVDPSFFEIYAKWTEALVQVGDVDTNSFAENASSFLKSSLSSVSGLLGNNNTSTTIEKETIVQAPVQESTSNNNNELLSALNALTQAIVNMQNSSASINAEIIQKLSKLPSNIATQIASQTLTTKQSNI